MASPFIYTMTVQDRNTGLDLQGEKFVHDLDSASYGKLKFAWTEEQLTVSETFGSDNERTIVVANLKGDKQVWARP